MMSQVRLAVMTNLFQHQHLVCPLFLSHVDVTLQSRRPSSSTRSLSTASHKRCRQVRLSVCLTPVCRSTSDLSVILLLFAPSGVYFHTDLVAVTADSTGIDSGTPHPPTWLTHSSGQLCKDGRHERELPKIMQKHLASNDITNTK